MFVQWLGKRLKSPTCSNPFLRNSSKPKMSKIPISKAGSLDGMEEKHRSITAGSYRKATVKESCPRKCGKATKAPTTNHVVKIIQYSGLHLQRERAYMRIVLTGLCANIACLLPTCPAAHAFDLLIFICISACHNYCTRRV